MIAGKTNHNVFVIAACTVFLLGLCQPVSGEVTFEWVTVGNLGNAADPLNEGQIPDIGSVAYEYRIAKYEVTNEQYAEFLNAVAATDTNGLFDEDMETDPHGGITQSGSSGSFTYSVKANMGNKPVGSVSFVAAMRFANWLHNGQPTGGQDASTTESGVYNNITDGVSETREDDWLFAIPTENEWYKAAYYHPAADGGPTDDYWLYATASDNVPTIATANATGDISNPGTNVANYSNGADWNGEDGNLTTVGSAGPDSESFYGTSDQAGNIWEWNEGSAFSTRHLRGGAWGNIESHLRSSQQDFTVLPNSSDHTVGFRVVANAAPPVPAVSEWGLMVMALLVLTAGTLVYTQRRPTPA